MPDLPPSPGDIVACRATIERKGGDVSQAPKWHVSAVDGDTMKIRSQRNPWAWRPVKVEKWIVVHRPPEL